MANAAAAGRRSRSVKGSRMPAAEGRCHALGRQASEKPQGRKPRAGFARWCPRAMGIVALAVVARGARLVEFWQHEAAADGDGERRRGTLRLRGYRNGMQERAPMRL